MEQRNLGTVHATQRCRNAGCKNYTKNRDWICDECRKPGVEIVLLCLVRTKCAHKMPEAYKDCWERYLFVRDSCPFRDELLTVKKKIGGMLNARE